MVTLAEMLHPSPSPLWTLVAEAGIRDVVSLLDGAEQDARMRIDPDGRPPVLPPVPPAGERPWDLAAIRALQARYADKGFRVAAIEDTAPMDKARLGLPGRDEQIDHVIDQIRAMGVCGIPVLCYNWMAVTSWARTRLDVPLRGGAVATGYDDAVNQALPPLAEPGSITHEQLWDALRYFLDAVVPVAEESGVVLGLHPDDPPLPEIRGVPRIACSIDNYRRILGLVDSPAHRATFCQGNFTLMTDDLPSVIREFGGARRIAFVHFRDVVGDVRNFHEVFHDEGKTDLAECMRAYAEVGFTGPLRPDHVPTLVGEDATIPGYSDLARLFAVGYIRGLREMVFGRATD